MSFWLPHLFENKKEILLKRAQVIKALRCFFDTRNFIEVQTPILQVCPVMDAHIHAFRTTLKTASLHPSKDLYLHTSPEFDMKKLLVAGMEKIYQIAPVFRNAEQGNLHSPEFTLLEWYRANEDYYALMDDCEALLRYIAETVKIKQYRYKDRLCDPFEPWERLSVCDAFKTYIGIDLSEYIGNRDAFADIIARQGIRAIESDGWEDIFHAAMAAKIEPYLGQGRPTILYDYPISMAALSRAKRENSDFAERFELYMCGIELANAFSELTDAAEQRARFEAEMKLKNELYGETYPPDEEFFKALEYGMPESTGIALGVDRLVMLTTGTVAIKDIQWAPTQT